MFRKTLPVMLLDGENGNALMRGWIRSNGADDPRQTPGDAGGPRESGGRRHARCPSRGAEGRRRGSVIRMIRPGERQGGGRKRRIGEGGGIILVG